MITGSNMLEVKKFIYKNKISLVYISMDNCKVCDAVFFKLQELLNEFPKIKCIFVKANEVPQILGEYLVFTAPTILFFLNGREVFRESRFVQFEKLKNHCEYLEKVNR